MPPRAGSRRRRGFHRDPRRALRSHRWCSGSCTQELRASRLLHGARPGTRAAIQLEPSLSSVSLRGGFSRSYAPCRRLPLSGAGARSLLQCAAGWRTARHQGVVRPTTPSSSWASTRECRLLAGEIGHRRSGDRRAAAAARRIWDKAARSATALKRRPDRLAQALSLCAHSTAQVKGHATSDPWLRARGHRAGHGPAAPHAGVMQHYVQRRR